VHRYFVYEHFERFLTSAASRPGPLHYFVWIVIAGLIPWTGFLWPAVREAVRGGPSGGLRASWARRNENAVGWFLITWAAFVFFFFSVSKSKLPPYILPIFPAVALLIGSWLARVAGEAGCAAKMRVGLGLFSFLNGVLAVALCMAVVRPNLVKLEPAHALALQLPAFAMAAALLLGGIFAPWLAKTRGVRAAVGAMVATMAAFLVALQFAAPDINKPSAKPLAEIVRARAQPGDRVVHYHEFFHNFTFYAQRVVDVVAFKGELELEEDAAARASGRFISDEEFRRQWNQPGRVFAVARRRDVDRELFTDVSFRYHLLGQTENLYLFSNQP
jgi:4-amino-4-deoxy-L-arabinose transferase-like glycosyltransferase